jgi:hypothetical protein
VLGHYKELKAKTFLMSSSFLLEKEATSKLMKLLMLTNYEEEYIMKVIGYLIYMVDIIFGQFCNLNSLVGINISTTCMMYSSLSLFNPSICYMEMTLWNLRVLPLDLAQKSRLTSCTSCNMNKSTTYMMYSSLSLFTMSACYMKMTEV